MSFLGLGKKISERVFRYDSALYHIDNINASKPYEFVQSAEIDILGGENFDKAFIIVTPQSKEQHFEKLKNEMCSLGLKDIQAIDIGTDLKPESQWNWFEQVLTAVDKGDKLTIDLTHGYRIGPIVISAAINFLQKSKNIILEHVFYGAFENDKDHPPIIDFKDFYIINEWADAVSRLVDDADARKLSDVAEKAPEFQIGKLGNPELIEAFNDLTASVRNVEIQQIGEKTQKALKIVNAQRNGSTKTAAILLDLVTDKFAALAANEPVSGKYDLDYFKLQLEVIKILNTHKLFMQSYTVMREFIGSIGLIQYKKARTTIDKRFKADIFVNMIQYDELNFPSKDQQKAADSLGTYFELLQNIDVVPLLKGFCKKLIEYRNGFSHTWTRGDAKAPKDIEVSANSFYGDLKKIVDILEKNNVFLS